jgi:hypothetical protein
MGISARRTLEEQLFSCKNKNMAELLMQLFFFFLPWPDSSNTQTSFTTGVSAMLSHDDGSTDGFDVSEFDLSTAQSQPWKMYEGRQHIKHNFDPEVSESDDESIEGIHFQSSHFNGDSSDEELEAFTQGLMFSGVSHSSQNPFSVRKTSESAPADVGEMLTSSVMNAVSRNISNLGAMGQSLLSTVISSATKQKEQLKQVEQASSDDSEEDFEMISQDDLS